LSESGFMGLWDFQDSPGGRVCQNQDLRDYRIFRIRPARVFVRIRISGIMGFSGFYPRVIELQALIHIRLGGVSGCGEKSGVCGVKP